MPRRLMKSWTFFIIFFVTFLLSITIEIIVVEVFIFGQGDRAAYDLFSIARVSSPPRTSRTSSLSAKLKKMVKEEDNLSSTSGGMLSLKNNETFTAKKGNQKLLPLDQLLRKAGVEVTPDIMSRLTPVAKVEELYGSEPILYGLSTCQKYRNMVSNEADRIIGPAGMFNTGTNLMAGLLQNNCANEARQNEQGKISRGVRWQVPWGKHSPPSWRGKHFAEVGSKVDFENFLPIVVIKDPYSWMISMCRHEYSAMWYHKESHCPNLFPVLDEEISRFNHSIPVEVQYTKNRTTHDSLAHLWNDWYTSWAELRVPYLVVRFEDILLHTEEVVRKVCECAGFKVETEFQYLHDSAKGGKAHKGSSGYVSAMIRYTNPTMRIENFFGADLHFAEQVLSNKLMNFFHYPFPIR